MRSAPKGGAEALIVGGGPAGATLAILLARQGRSVEILEQTASAQHKVCGEFLSHEAAEYLEQLGVSPRRLGAAAIHAVRLHARTTIASCELPFPALSVTRRALDEALLELAGVEGAVVIRGRRVERLESDSEGWRAGLRGGESRCAGTAFLATGKHDLGGHRRPEGRQRDLVAFKMYFRLSPVQERALGGWVELFLFPGGYAGLQLVEEEQANLCLVVERRTLVRCHRDWSKLLEHMSRFSTPLAERLDGAEALLAKPLAVSSMPYGMLPGDAEGVLWRIGDQSAVIPPFAGDGMSIALHSAYLAAEIYGRGGTAEEYTRRLRREVSLAVQLATTISRLMTGAPATAQVLRVWPGLLARIATHTRVPQQALSGRTFHVRYKGCVR